MQSKSKRPISVWIAQILLAIYGVGSLLIILWGFYLGLTEGIPSPELYLVTTVGLLTFVAVFLGGVWGMAIRKPWGRWLGVAGLTILLVATAITQTSRGLSVTDGSSGLVSIGFFFRVIVVLGLAFLAYKVAAGDAADEFFDSRSETTNTSSAESESVG